MAEAAILHVVSNVVINVISSIVSTPINGYISKPVQEFKCLDEIHVKVRKLETNLQTIRIWLEEVGKKPRRSTREADIVHQIEGVAYDAQNVMDELSWLQQLLNRTDAPSLPSIEKICEYIIPLPQIGTQIDSFIGSITDILKLTEALSNLNIGESSSTINQSEAQSRETIPTNEDKKVIGFADQIQKIRDMLIWKDHEQLSVISIVGMGGIGKSTLAREIFNDFVVKNLFPNRIWIDISEQYNEQYCVQIIDSGGINHKIRKMVNFLVHLVLTNKDKGVVEKMTVGEVRAMLSKSLQVGKCLIVIDGIQNTESWDAISDHNSIFGNVNNGSRIIKTTRNHYVARFPERINNIETEVYEVELLDDEKSKELLKTKAFPSNPSKDKLIEQIIQKCNGLPLALIGLRDFKSESASNTWSISSHEINGEDLPISKSLALSYNDLPLHLKPIFLYITCFPGGDQFIRVSELIKLWIAEDFIKHDDNCAREKTARRYVEELCNRCLVKVKKRSKTHDWITRITIHDVVRDWGRSIAKKEKFFKIIKQSDDVEVAKLFYRVAVHEEKVNNHDLPMSKFRTLLGFHLPDENIITSSGLNSARVVTLNPSCFIQKSPECIKNVIFLQCICLQKFHGIRLPESIGQLFRLQTLDCRESTIEFLHFSLWKISTLRHLYLQDVCCNWSYPKNGSGIDIRSVYIYDRPRKISGKKNLFRDIYDGLKNSSKTILTRYKAPGLDEFVDAVEGMADIVTLGLISYAVPLPQKVLKKISHLSSLEVLELSEKEVPVPGTTGLSSFPPNYIFPKKLKKVKLDCPNLKEDPMPFWGKLPGLVVLELSNVTKLNSMNSSGTDFPLLKHLTIINFSGEELKADDGAMPYLCQLTLDGCTNLNTVSGKFQGHEGLARELTNGTPPNL